MKTNKKNNTFFNFPCNYYYIINSIGCLFLSFSR
ncbi:Uncharacterised protein [Salmonella enterica subsp. enterica serovar Panama]|nr:Uncharacterised protein [Salmonella enterica subsp. enterica serovar Panama]